MPTTPDDIFEAIDKTIRLIETLISALDAMCREFEIHEIACKRAKTVGTTMNVLGAGVAIGIAFFTCGASLFPYALGGAIGGAAGNLLVNVHDNYETRGCIRRINSLLDDFRSEMEKLQSLVEQFNKELENSMKTHNIGWQGATLHHFGCPTNTNFNLLSFLGNMKVLIPSIKTSVTMIAGVGSYYMMFLMKSFPASAGKLGPAAGLSIGLRAAFATGSKAGMLAGAGAVAGKVLAGVGVVFAAYDLACLIRNLMEDHPTLDSIREAKSQLQKQKTSLREILSEFKKIKRAAEETVLNALAKFMQECLGGGHKTVNGRLEPITFEEFVNQIGDGREGGVFQLAFIAEMFGQSIEIFDRTADGVIGRQHGSSHMKIDPFERLLSQVPLQLELSGDSGQHHYRPISKGCPIDVAKSSRYPNRCLFDAIAHLKGISSNELISQLKAFLLTNSVAQEVYNLNLEHLFPEFRGGARRPKPSNVNPTNTVKVTRSARQTFTDRNGKKLSREVVTATVQFRNLNQGATHSDRIGAEIRARGIQKLDHCGHIIARELGGPGDDINNFTPMNAWLNQVMYRGFEVIVKKTLQCNPTWSARFNVSLIFDPSSAFPNRPFRVDAKVEFYDQNGTLLISEGVVFVFDNPDVKIE